MKMRSVKGYRLVFGYLGNFIILMGIVLLIPLFVIPFFPSEVKYIGNFLIPSLISIVVGILLSLLIFKKEKAALQKNQDAIIVVFGWIICFIIGSFPFFLKSNGETYTFLQSLFEVVSGFTTTGITVVDVETSPSIFLFYRSVTLFFGGLGIILALIILFRDNSGMALYNAEGHEDRLMSNLIKSSKTIFLIFASFVVAGTLLYVLCGMSVFDAINHAISSVSTGGFSTKYRSIGHYNDVRIEIITIVLMLLGATNFLAHLYLIRGKFKNFFKYNEVKTMLIILAVVIPLFTIVATFSNPTAEIGFLNNLRNVSFKTVSGLTGAGLQLDSIENLNTVFPSFFIVLMLLMVIGGSSGSTSGGIKLYRFGIVCKNVVWQLSDNMRPGSSLKKMKYIYRLDGREYLNDKKLLNVNFLILAYLSLIMIIAISFTIVNSNFDITIALFDATSLVSTAGFSFGIVNKDASNIILGISILGMFLGRLEIFIIITCFTRIYRDTKRNVQNKVNSW